MRCKKASTGIGGQYLLEAAVWTSHLKPSAARPYKALDAENVKAFLLACARARPGSAHEPHAHNVFTLLRCSATSNRFLFSLLGVPARNDRNAPVTHRQLLLPAAVRARLWGGNASLAAGLDCRSLRNGESHNGQRRDGRRGGGLAGSRCGIKLAER